MTAVPVPGRPLGTGTRGLFPRDALELPRAEAQIRSR